MVSATARDRLRSSTQRGAISRPAGVAAARDVRQLAGIDCQAVPPPRNEHLNERQKWILAKLRRGGSVRRCDVEQKFGVVAKTARRDLGE
jgi:hypothetical protein